MRQSAKIKLGGGGLNSLTKDTILRGVGQYITDIDYDNIVNNRLIFTSPELIIQKTALDADDITCNIVYFNSNLYYYKKEIDSNFQISLIPNLGINILENSNISVNFSDGGWTSNYDYNYLYTNSQNIGIGISEPLSTLHIFNQINPGLIIDNDINKFSFNYSDDVFNFGTNNISQFNIHKNANPNSLYIDTTSTVNINYDINIKGHTYLTPDININTNTGQKNIITWLTENEVASKNFVLNTTFLRNDSILAGIGSNITQLDYNNITLNKLIFLEPLIYNPINNNIDIDLSATGWTNNSINIYSTFNSNVGIGTTNPLGTLHIGSANFIRNNSNNDGTLIISKSTFETNNNFKIGYNDLDFTFGDYSTYDQVNNHHIWKKQFYINKNAPDNSLIIKQNGDININNNLTTNDLICKNVLSFEKNNFLSYAISINDANNLKIGNTIFINTNNCVAIGSPSQEDFKLFVDGDIKTTSHLYVNNIYASNLCQFNNVNLSNLNIFENVNVTNINSTNIFSANITNTSLIRTNRINTTFITSSNNITTSNLIANNNVISSNITIFNRLNANIINARSLTLNNITNNLKITSSNIDITNDLNVSSNIFTNTLTSSDIVCNNIINSKKIITDDIDITYAIIYKLNTNIINNSTIINTNDINNTNNITTTSINSPIIFSSNAILSSTLTSRNINSTIIINSEKITTFNLDIRNNIVCDATIKSTNLNVVRTLTAANIGINTTEPKSELHIFKNPSSVTNTAIILSGLDNTNNKINYKVGYNNDGNQLILGPLNIELNTWTNQISISQLAPVDTFIIKRSGNISLGRDTNDIYKLNVIGDFNATNIYENGVKILTSSGINTIINTKLNDYLPLIDANEIYSTKFELSSKLLTTQNNIEDIITSLLSITSNIYTYEQRYPLNNIVPIGIFNVDSMKYYENNNIYGFTEKFSDTIINIDNSESIFIYNIYYSSSKFASSTRFYIINKYSLFNYIDFVSLLSITWDNNYNYSGYVFNDINKNNIRNPNIEHLNKNSLILSTSPEFEKRYYGDFIIVKLDFDLILTKFRFYVVNTKIFNAPASWRCYVSNDLNTEPWIELKDASNDIFANRLITVNYIDTNNGYSYYEKKIKNLNKYKYIAFIFSAVVYNNLDYSGTLIPLELFKIEFFGKKELQPLYVSSNVLNTTLANYVKSDYINQYMQYQITAIEPLRLINNTLSIDASILTGGTSGDSTVIYERLRDNITAYINSKTDIWTRFNNHIFYNIGTVGIGTTIPNPTLDGSLRLNVNGNIITSGNINVGNNITVNNSINVTNINCINTITAFKYVGDGSVITNINYNNINLNRPNLSNLNNWTVVVNNNISNCFFSILNGNIGIGYGTNTTLTTRLSVNGGIYATGSINTNTNLQENSINLVDKYLRIDTATNTFFKIAGGVINGSVGINTNISDNHLLNVNGSINANTIRSIDFIENGSSLSSKYLTIIAANYEYLSKISGGRISGSVGIGTSTTTNNRLTVDGNIYSSNNISCFGNLNEGGSNLIDKYLTINNANSNYLKIQGGIISGSLGIGITNSDSYKLNINGSLNTNSLYISGTFIDFPSYATISLLNSTLLLYPTLIHLTDNYISSNNFINTIELYSETGKDPNYLKIIGGTITNDLTITKNLNVSNIITSNIINYNNINTSNLISSNIINDNTIQTIFLTSDKITIGSPNPSDYNLNVNGSLNTISLYISGTLINFSSYATISLLNSTLLLYPTLIHLTDNYISSNNFINTIGLYSETGKDPNYLKIIGGTIPNDTTFSKNIFTSNIINDNTIQTNNFLTSGKVSISSLSLSDYNLNVNGSLNTISLYISGNLINFSSYATISLLNSTLLLYPTLIHLTDNYISSNNFINTIGLYSETGKDPNYLKIIGGTITNDLTITKNLNVSNIITSNIINNYNINTSNLISSNIDNNNLIISHSIYSKNNIGIGTTPSDLYKLNINGSIYSSNNINCFGNLNEGGINLSDKYLTITNANNNYFKINGGIINNNVGIGTNISDLYRLNVNGSIYSSNNIICFGNLNEGGVNLNNKYLTINNATNNYLSINGGSILNNLTILSNIGVGTIATSIYRLAVRGAIYSSTDIYSAGSISESGNFLKDKYLSFNGGTILSNLTINSNLGVGTIASDLYKLNVKGSIYSSNDIICDGNIKENGSFLKDKYLSINFAINNIDTVSLRNELSSNQPNVQKKIGFRFICNKPIVLNSETFYKYDVNISSYVKTKKDADDTNPYRIFGIKCFSTSAIFNNTIANKPPNILQYDIYSSYMINTNTINICAIGFPSNYYLNKITSGDIFILKTNNYNYISILSRTNNLSISCIISDFLF